MEKKIIGICGVSCSGKSTLVKELKKYLPDDVDYVCFDDYYIRSRDLPDKSISWEDPRHYKMREFIDDLKRLKRLDKQLVIVEGFLILFDKNARKLFDQTIFIDLPEQIMINRRLKRRREGDTVTSILSTFILGQREFVYSQKELADIVLSGSNSPQKLAREVFSIIK
jgi:uridine kinase